MKGSHCHAAYDCVYYLDLIIELPLLTILSHRWNCKCCCFCFCFLIWWSSLSSASRTRSANKPPLTSIFDDSRGMQQPQQHSGFRSANGRSSAGAVELLQSPPAESHYAGPFSSPAASISAAGVTPTPGSASASRHNRSPHFALEPYAPAMDKLVSGFRLLFCSCCQLLHLT